MKSRMSSLRRSDVVSFLISRMPWNSLRVALYRMVCGFQISRSAKIGFGTVLAVDEAIIGSAVIGKFNRFRGAFVLVVEDGAQIHQDNDFICGRFASGAPRSCTIGRNTVITVGHLIDAIGGFEVGSDSWLGGRHSEYWTHGAGIVDKCTIGSDCYIGSAVRFAPGAAVGNKTIVGMGSVVTQRFEEDCVFVAGAPAKIIKGDYYWRERKAADRIDGVGG